jgi:hypothetical protein
MEVYGAVTWLCAEHTAWKLTLLSPGSLLLTIVQVVLTATSLLARSAPKGWNSDMSWPTHCSKSSIAVAVTA